MSKVPRYVIRRLYDNTYLVTTNVKDEPVAYFSPFAHDIGLFKSKGDAEKFIEEDTRLQDLVKNDAVEVLQILVPEGWTYFYNFH
jgi:hypothetical protein